MRSGALPPISVYRSKEHHAMGNANFAREAEAAVEADSLAASLEWRAFAQAAHGAALDAGALKVIEAAGL